MTLTQEEKQLLLQDICGRLPYKVKCLVSFDDGTKDVMILKTGLPNDFGHWDFYNENCSGYSNNFKPYLRPMSSMTEEEKEELLNLLFDKEAKYFYIDEEGLIDGKTSYLMKEGLNYPAFCPINIVLYTDWLNAHHFDYRGLIEKGLALEAPEGMYDIK